MVAGALQNERVRIVSSGCYHSIVLTNSGKLFGMGLNTRKQLGKDEGIMYTTPVELTEITRSLNGTINNIYAGCNHTILQMTSGELFCFGANEKGT